MRGLDGAKKCDIVGLYILSKLNLIDGTKAGLFRDDGAAITTLSPKEAEKVKNKIVKVFKDEGLNITIVANLKVMTFLDVEADLNTGTHKPYTKPNNTLLYIDVNSNHPKSNIQNTAKAVERRLSMKKQGINTNKNTQHILQNTGGEITGERKVGSTHLLHQMQKLQ